MHICDLSVNVIATTFHVVNRMIDLHIRPYHWPSASVQRFILNLFLAAHELPENKALLSFLYIK